VTQRPSSRPAGCPDWCVVRHGTYPGEEDHLHASAALQVRQTVLRLCSTIDPATGRKDGPYVLLGEQEYSLYEADALIDALTQLVDAEMGVSPRAGA
jgi:hypothetical protein